MVNNPVEIEAKNKKKKHFYTLKMVATGYSHTGNTCYTGVWPKVGTAAVDPSVIPLYSELHVKGYGKCVALDTGGAIVGSRIDLFFERYEDAINWGVKTVEVRVYY